MENQRRPFDRPRGPGLKKQRLTEDLSLNPNARLFPQRSNPVGPASALRFRSNGSETNDGAYEPQPVSHHQQQQQQIQDLVSQYKTALAELTFNSKPIITNLTIIAGENAHAARAIAGTICAHIIEVPSDQKLSSLYLLDSIVKNIGRDYIKHFAVKLPEVFIKAYRQVDPPVHQSMRHLFGTWKGVFPLHCLQAIEKELGFATVVNGSSGTTTSRTDPVSQRPPHSIHVNPKYLEKQRLQHSSREKDMTDDMTGTLVNSKEDYERPDRAAITAERTYGDPSVIMNLCEMFLKTPGAGVGRASVTKTISSQRNGFNIKHESQNYSGSKSVNADPRLLARQNIAGRSSNVLPCSWKNSEEEEFMWEMHSRVSQHDASDITTNSRKDHWIPDVSKKLDFESPLHRAQNLYDVASGFNRETSSESLSTEQQDKPSYGRQVSSAWQLQESHKTDGLPVNSSSHSESYSTTIGRLPTAASSSVARIEMRPEMGSSHLGTSGSMVALGQQRFHSMGTASPPEQSPMRHHSPSPPFPARHTHKQLQKLVEPQTHFLPQSDPRPKPSQFSGKLDVGSLKHSPHVSSSWISQPSRQYSLSQPAKPDPVQAEHSCQIQKPLMSQISEVETAPKFGNATERTDPLAVETPELSSTSCLLAAVMKSGILSNNSFLSSLLPKKISQDLGKMPSQPSLPSGSLSANFTTSGMKVDTPTLSGSASHDAIATATTSSQGKVKQQPPSSLVNNAPLQTSDPESKALTPVSNLLSSLVAKGLISASKKDAPSLPTLQNPTHMQKSPETEKPTESLNKSLDITTSSPLRAPPISSSSDAHRSSTMDKISFAEPPTKISVPSHQLSSMDTKNVIGLDFKPDLIKEFHSSVISGLLDDLPYCCSLCGLRLKLQERLNIHLKWHAMKKTKPEGSDEASRGWYIRSDNWIAGKPGKLVFEPAGSVNQLEKTTEKTELMVPADENQYACMLCGELFEDFFSHDRDEWMFKGAVHLTIPSKDGEVGPIVHANCMSDSSVHELGLAGDIKMEQEE